VGPHLLWQLSAASKLATATPSLPLLLASGCLVAVSMCTGMCVVLWPNLGSGGRSDAARDVVDERSGVLSAGRHAAREPVSCAAVMGLTGRVRVVGVVEPVSAPGPRPAAPHSPFVLRDLSGMVTVEPESMVMAADANGGQPRVGELVMVTAEVVHRPSGPPVLGGERVRVSPAAPRPPGGSHAPLPLPLSLRVYLILCAVCGFGGATLFGLSLRH
jgi:hypothetical protein